MITLELLQQRMQVLEQEREQLARHAMQVQDNLNAYNGAIEELQRLLDLLMQSEPEPVNE